MIRLFNSRFTFSLFCHSVFTQAECTVGQHNVSSLHELQNQLLQNLDLLLLRLSDSSGSLAAVYHKFLPWMVVGALSVLSVLLCWFLPETFRQPLPDTIEQLALTQRSVGTACCLW